MKITTFLAGLLLSATALARPAGGGLLINKSCPQTPVAPGASVTCTFTVQNRNLANGVTDLALTNTFNGGSPGAVLCYATPALTGSPVTELAARGQSGDTCYGSVTETAPACTVGTQSPQDVIDGTADDIMFGTVSGSGTGFFQELACTPTNTPTASNTPTVTLTPTPTVTLTPTTPPTGMSVVKTCPASGAPGSVVTCSFTVTNLSPVETLDNLAVYNVETDPVPQIGTGPWPCYQFAVAVTTLGPAGGGSESCSGTLTETMPGCNPVVASLYHDTAQAFATVRGTGDPRLNYAQPVAITIPACTPTPTGTQPTGTSTPTSTPTVTGTPPTATKTPTPTNTFISVSNTPTRTQTPTLTFTVTPSRTPTLTSTPTRTPTRTPTPPPCHDPTILTGFLGDASGAGLNGRLLFTLSRPAMTLPGACSFFRTPFTVPARQISFKLVNGSIPTPPLTPTPTVQLPVILGNDCLTPTTYYRMSLVGTSFGVVLRRNVTITCYQNDIGGFPDAPLP